MYTLYVNIEHYEKKTWGVAAGTGIAAAVNIGLNAIFIPLVVAFAAFSTLLYLSYVVRLIVAGVYMIMLVIVTTKYKGQIIALLRSKKA